jgi:hypothetical protein
MPALVCRQCHFKVGPLCSFDCNKRETNVEVSTHKFFSGEKVSFCQFIDFINPSLLSTWKGKKMFLCVSGTQLLTSRVARFVPVRDTKTGKSSKSTQNAPNSHKITQMFLKYSK